MEKHYTCDRCGKDIPDFAYTVWKSKTKKIYLCLECYTLLSEETQARRKINKETV